MICDHEPARQSLNVFTAATRIIGVQPDGAGGWLLLGVCYQCSSTLAIELCDCRSSVRRGDIETAPGRCTECLAPVVPQTDEEWNDAGRNIT